MDFIYILGWVAVICVIGWRINNSRELSKKVANDIKNANPNISKEDLDNQVKGFEKDVSDEGWMSMMTGFWIIVGILFIIFFLIPMFSEGLSAPEDEDCYGMGQTYTC